MKIESIKSEICKKLNFQIFTELNLQGHHLARKDYIFQQTVDVCSLNICSFHVCIRVEVRA